MPFFEKALKTILRLDVSVGSLAQEEECNGALLLQITLTEDDGC